MERIVMIRKLHEISHRMAFQQGFLEGINADSTAIELAEDVIDSIDDLIVDLYAEEDKEHARAGKDDLAQSWCPQDPQMLMAGG